MKTLKKLKLNKLNSNALDAHFQKVLKGGSDKCLCSCTTNCYCESWDGTGLIPPYKSQMDLGSENRNAYVGSLITSWL